MSLVLVNRIVGLVEPSTEIRSYYALHAKTIQDPEIWAMCVRIAEEKRILNLNKVRCINDKCMQVANNMCWR